MSKEPLAPVDDIPIQVQSVVLNIFQRFKNVKNMQVRPFIEEMITFVSVIGAYYSVCLSFEKQSVIQEWTGFKFTNSKTQSAILLIFALYLISLKLLYVIAYRYETAPPKKAVPIDWQQMQQAQKQSPEPTQLPEQQRKALPPNSYSTMIQNLINYSVYGIVFMLCTTSYTFTSVFNKKNDLVEIEQVNYLVLWFVISCIFYSFGKILGKSTKINTFHHFGLAVGIIVILIQIGLAHGCNMFVFL